MAEGAQFSCLSYADVDVFEEGLESRSVELAG